MRKILAALLAVTLLMTLGLTGAFASGEAAGDEYDVVAARVEAFMGGGDASGEASSGSNEPVVYEPGTVTAR